MNEQNEGISVTGGSFNAEVVAVGQNAQAVKTVYASADELEDAGKKQVAEALKELLKALEAHSGSIGDEQEILEAVQKVAEEIKKDKPSKLTIKSLLDGLKNALEPLTDVVQKVVALRGAIGLLLGISGL